MRHFLKSTTALCMSVALILPTTLPAQDLSNCGMDGDELLFPCMVEGAVIRSAEELNEILSTDNAVDTDAENTDERTEALEEADAAAVAERRAAEQAAEEARAAEEAERQAAEQAAREAEEARQAEAEAAARAEAEAEEQAQREREQLEAAERQAEADRAALRAQRRAEREAELAAAAAAAEAAERGEGTGEVVTEEITEEAVRTSDEEFETAVTGDSTVEDSDDGLSKFEKALLLGLGAVAVGAVLKNGDRVVSRSGDRVVVEDPNGDLRVLKDDDALIRRPGDQVTTETFDDGSSRNIVTKPDGSKVITIRGRDGSVLRRVNVDARGNEYILFDDLSQEEEVVLNELPQVQSDTLRASATSEDALRAALQAEQSAMAERRFSLRQVREISQVRALAPELELDAVRFATGSAAIRPEQARSLTQIGTTLSRLVQEDPRTVILVEGHTDAVGDRTYNLALSDRRAETVALALTEYFGVPAENMITQGYGESALKVPTLDAEPANRRAVVRNITGLLR